MRVHSIVNTVPPMAAFRLGMVLAAHGNRAFCRTHCTGAAASFQNATKELDTGGIDSKWFDEQAKNYAEGQFNEATRAKIASEKYYKKQRLDFLTEFPELASVLEEMIPGSTHDKVKQNA